MIRHGALDKRHSYSESSLCDLESSLHDCSLKTPEVTRAQMKSPELCTMATKRISHLKQYLVTPILPAKETAARPKPSGRVLTSSECIKITEEKERKKKEKLLEKEAKKKQREKKQQEKMQECQPKSTKGDH